MEYEEFGKYDDNKSQSPYQKRLLEKKRSVLWSTMV